tara:strand:+ start:326 stop:448 length:123 start_codon:yes stop_codon:yes gene_type:complete
MFSFKANKNKAERINHLINKDVENIYLKYLLNFLKKKENE